MKPLIRWTIGSAHPCGFQILKHSINSVKKLYNDKFRYVICFNNLNKQQKGIIEKLDCELLDQANFHKTLSLKPPKTSGGPAWKLYPPRISTHATEIFIDNDLIIFDKSWFMDNFTDEIFYTEAIKRSYGRFDCFVKENFTLNSGIVVVPPDLDLAQHLNDNIQKLGIKCWTSHFDEQALFASVVQNFKNVMIPLSDISVGKMDGKLGIHFIGANGGEVELWKNYFIKKVLI